MVKPDASHQPPDDESLEEYVSFFDFVYKTVNLALQAHNVWNLEIDDTVGEIVNVAKALAGPDINKGVFDPRKISAIPAVNREAVIKAIAIYTLVAAETFGISDAEMEKRVQRYTKEFRA